MARYDAVIFDMDGTLIEQMLDFRAIRAEFGIAPQDGIIEAIDQMPSDQRESVSRKLLDYELAAAGKARLMPGAAEVVKLVRRAGLKAALLTRNARGAMEIVLDKFFTHNFTERPAFDITWSREDGPIKPEPDGILRACEQLGVRPEKTCCVGDFRYDITAANAAGATSVLLMARGELDFADQADYVIRTLDELIAILGISR